jgi:hypothetical protein
VKSAKFLFALMLCLIFSGFTSNLNAQQEKTKVFLITLDGLRWQELFTGVDSVLVHTKSFTSSPKQLEEFMSPTSVQEKRASLMPFVWNSVVKMGTVYGNRHFQNKVNLTNKMWFSYPGYNEILTGKADDERITSNSKINNPNVTVLEEYQQIAKRPYASAAFGSWDVFPFIVNEERSGVYVNAGFEPANHQALSPEERLLNDLQQQVPSPWSTVRLDGFTHQYAKTFIKKYHPDLVYIAYGETDDFAHNGNYEAYIKATHNTDALLKELWELTQNENFYRDQTLFIITTDHGRGTVPIESWKSHGASVSGADQTWIMIYGAGVEPQGELQNQGQFYANQIAPTIRKIMGLENKGVDQGFGKALDIRLNHTNQQ